MLNSQLFFGTFSALSILTLVKIIKRIRTKILTKTHFKNKTVLITGASSGLGKGTFTLNSYNDHIKLCI